jgi:lipopolysaccharide/colanic/teichoic acid biosynthesis glycosyltransferase
MKIELALKRLMDISISGLLLAFCWPVLLLIAVMIKATSKGPALFPCHWIGKDGTPFVGYKFRSMVDGAEGQEQALQDRNEMTGPAFKLTDDPRITPLGRVLRKYSLDETPQLWSVFKGDLSLVGPRPPRAHEYARFTEFQRRKMSVKPGITCLWQVEGRHRINNYDEWVERDLDYIRRWSLWLDIQILARTAIVVFRGTGI